jgi:hypothetical protein
MTVSKKSKGGKPPAASLSFDEALQRVKEKKAERSRRRDPNLHTYFRRVLRPILSAIEPDQVYSTQEIRDFLAKSGERYTSAGPALTYGVREGYLERLCRGWYRLTGKKLED